MARLTARVTKETWPYRLKADRTNPPEEQIRWTLKQLPAAVRRLIMGMTEVVGKQVTLNPDRYWVACKHGISSVENLFSEDGSAIVPEFVGKNNAELSDDFITQLPEDWVWEIGTAIIESTKLTEEEKKLCGLQLTQHTTSSGPASAPPSASSPPPASS